MSSKLQKKSNIMSEERRVRRYRDLLLKAEQNLNSGNLVSAEKYARTFQKDFPNDAKANQVLAQVLVAFGEFYLALPFAEKAVEIAPFHPSTNYFLGRLYLGLQIFELAAPLFEKILKIVPDSALLNWAFADMYMEMNLGENAAVYYEKAIACSLDEERHLEIKRLYAHCLSSIDRHKEAEKQMLEVKDTKDMRALFLFSKSKNPGEDLDAIKLEIQTTLTAAIPVKEKEMLHHALGSLFEVEKDYDSAFKEWQVARELTNRPYPIEAYTGTIDNLIHFYSKEFIERLKVHGHSSATPVFVVGMARSGTTLTEQVIAAHRDGAGVGELGRMSKIENVFFDNYCENPDSEKIFRNVANGELLGIANGYLNLLGTLTQYNPKRIVDKAVSQYLAAGLIHACFPNARFIHCNRHPADSFVSAFQNRLDHDYVSNQNHYAQYYLGKEKLFAHWRTCFPTRIFDLNYEEMVRDPETNVRKMIAFLDLDWDPSCLKFFEKKSTVQTLSITQVRNPIYTSSVYRWTKYEKHLGPLFAAFKEANYTYPEF
jgi:tetratricopeptide (TPR) repeat protein